MTRAIARPEKERYLLVEFRYGIPSVPTYSRYTDWTQDTFGYTSTPTMEIELAENVGTFDDREVKIILPIDDFTGGVAKVWPHSPIFVTIEELTAGLFPGDAGSRRKLYRGRITRAVRNYQGRNDCVAFLSLPLKSRLDIPMGLQCNHHCINRLFSPMCGLDQSLYQETGEIAAIDGKEVTFVSDPQIEDPFAPGDNTRLWERGYLQRNGLKISIRIWNKADNPDLFVLRERAPDDWLLAGPDSILLVPGCHKTIEDCRNVWDNEQGQGGRGGFNGLGYAIPAYNPIISNPQQSC